MLEDAAGEVTAMNAIAAVTAGSGVVVAVRMNEKRTETALVPSEFRTTP